VHAERLYSQQATNKQSVVMDYKCHKAIKCEPRITYIPRCIIAVFDSVQYVGCVEKKA